jgi:hypothetical protein
MVPNLLLFVRMLRLAGLAISTEQVLTVVRGLELVNVGRRPEVYHAARALLVTRKEDLPVFDLVFARFWRAGLGTSAARATHKRPAPPTGAPAQGSFTIATYEAFKASQIAAEVEVEDRRGTWSSAEMLRSRRFSELTPNELDALRRLMRDMTWNVALRRTRRLIRSSRGRRADIRGAMRQALRHGGLVMKIPKRTERTRERPLVLLADISGSMERYSRVALQFLHGALRSRRDVECFVFGTRLTRLTPQLRVRNVDQAIAAAARLTLDWGGGTRIGDSLHEFNRRWSRRVLRRGAVAVILSDGLDRGNTALLRREMRWLRDRSWRLIWLNPLAGSRDFAPIAEGMAAAREFVDDLLPAHNLESLDGFVRSLHTLSRRRPPRRSMARVLPALPSVAGS